MQPKATSLISIPVFPSLRLRITGGLEDSRRRGCRRGAPGAVCGTKLDASAATGTARPATRKLRRLRDVGMAAPPEVRPVSPAGAPAAMDRSIRLADFGHFLSCARGRRASGPGGDRERIPLHAAARRHPAGRRRRVSTPGRLLSLDLLRGLVVLLMLFVNQADSVEGASDFLRHAGETADAVTLADLVLPAFLFMVGMSIPFALGSRLRREGRGSALRHVLARTAALVVIGVLMVNADVGLPIGPLAPRWWGVLAIVAALLVWQAPPNDATRRRAWQAARAVGVLLLVALVLVYRGPAGGLVQIRPHWWGILGTLGWAYLTASLVYPARARPSRRAARRRRAAERALLPRRARGAGLAARAAALVRRRRADRLAGRRGARGHGARRDGRRSTCARRARRGACARARSRWRSCCSRPGRCCTASTTAATRPSTTTRRARRRPGGWSRRRSRPSPGPRSSPRRTAPAGGAGRRSCASPARTRCSRTCSSRVALALLAGSAVVFGRNPWAYLVERGTASGPARGGPLRVPARPARGAARAGRRAAAPVSA